MGSSKPLSGSPPGLEAIKRHAEGVDSSVWCKACRECTQVQGLTVGNTEQVRCWRGATLCQTSAVCSFAMAEAWNDVVST